MKNKVTGIGGIFFSSSNSKESKEWYEKNLGIPNGEYGHSFMWRDAKDPQSIGRTVWSISGEYFDTGKEKPSNQSYMINYRVENLEELLKDLESNGVTIVGKLEEYEGLGKFAHILDLDGNKIELWESAPEKPLDENSL